MFEAIDETERANVELNFDESSSSKIATNLGDTKTTYFKNFFKINLKKWQQAHDKIHRISGDDETAMHLSGAAVPYDDKYEADTDEYVKEMVASMKTIQREAWDTFKAHITGA